MMMVPNGQNNYKMNALIIFPNEKSLSERLNGIQHVGFDVVLKTISCT